MRFCFEDGSALKNATVNDSDATGVQNETNESQVYEAISNGQSEAPQNTALSAIRTVQITRRDKIFICYNHNDEDWLDQFKVFLKPHFDQHEISPWHDQLIDVGAKWAEETDKALNSACVAVLLLTPNFFNSEYIQKVELPRLREAARTDGLQILWVAVRASAINDTELSQYQGLNNPAYPLANMTPGERDAKLVEICREIKRKAKPIEVSQSVGQSAATIHSLSPLRQFDTRMSDIELCVPDQRGRLWIANAQQVKIFEIGREKPVESWLRPNKSWKHHLQAFWRNQLITSDWDGSVYQSSADDGDRLLYQAHQEDLPVHRLAIGLDGQLIAACWDGTIRIWAPDGSIVKTQSRIVVPHLPLQIIPLTYGSLAVVDQAGYVHIYSAQGHNVWSWRAHGAIRDAWASASSIKNTFIAQLEDHRLIKIEEGETNPEEIKFKTITALSRITKGGEEWIVVAQSGGQVDWLSTSLFGVVRDNSTRLDFEIREIFALSDPEQPNTLIALGVTSEGKLFSLNGHDTTRYDLPANIHKVVTDPTARFIFVNSDDKITAYRNPAIMPSRCRVELAEPIGGHLEVGAFRKLTIKLKNTGRVPIFQMKAELISEKGIIDTARSKEQHSEPVFPGEVVEAEFSVRAKVPGYLPLGLKVELIDEGGALVEQSLDVESVASRSGPIGDENSMSSV